MRNVEWNQGHSGGPAEPPLMDSHGAPRGWQGVGFTGAFGRGRMGTPSNSWPALRDTQGETGVARQHSRAVQA